MAAATSGRPLFVRNPDAVRPWQHVLEPLCGYLLLAEKLWEEPRAYGEGWNFGPAPDDVRPVHWIVERLNHYLDDRVEWQISTLPKPHEAQLLTLDSTKARSKLDWKPRWTLEEALRAIAEWHNAYARGERLRDVTMQQIARYEGAAQRRGRVDTDSFRGLVKSADLLTDFRAS
jgi:CDP-glucose 4,6-dehydratase